MNSDSKIYFDYQATTPIDPRVVDEMISILRNKNIGNPHSRSHSFGWEAESIVDINREKIANLIAADPKDIIFTSGATESNNLAIKGPMSYIKKEEGKNHIIIPITEHKCVIEIGRYLENNGFLVTFLPVKSDGLISIEELSSHINDKTAMISVMTVNNEIGVIQPIEEIGQICKDKGIIFHTDAAQAFGKIPIDVDKLNIDMMSFTSHKIYGPIGIGGLYVRRKSKKIRLHPLFHGGGQERGFRSGTLSPFLIAGFGKAAEIAGNEMEKDSKHVKKLFDLLYDGIFSSLDYVHLNGSKEKRYYGNSNISFSFIEGESLLMGLKDLAVSSGSACTSASLEASYVLKALGLSDELAHSSIRFGFGRFSTEDEIKKVIEMVKVAVKKLRDLSPLWEMVQEGINLDEINWE